MIMKNYLIVLLSALGFVSCTTEVDITGKWKNIPVVYSIIDQADSVHYVRINRVFSGNQSAYDMAIIPDSLLYDDTLDVKIHVFDKNNIRLKTITFTKEMRDKDSINQYGEVIFATDKHHVYASREEIPEEKGYSYNLVVKLNKDKQVEATIQSIVGFNQTNPPRGGRYDISQVILGATFRLPTAVHGAQMNMYVHYYEFYNDNRPYVRKTIMFPFNKVLHTTNDELTMGMKTFLIKSKFKEEIQNDPEVSYRFLGKVDFEYFIADIPFSEHLWLRNNTIVGETSPLTNIKGGYGLFACRKNFIYKGHKPTIPNSYKAFNDDPDLRLLKFPKPLVYQQHGIDTLP